MGRDMAEKKGVTQRSMTRLVREGEFVAEVTVNVLDAEGGWSPYLSLEDAYKLDEVREALRDGDVHRAVRMAHRVYRLMPVDA